MSLKVLVADDNEVDRMILGSIVERQGHEVLAVSDGQEAVDVFREQRPDIVLLDALMPNMDGLEAARQIKRMAGKSFVPVIFLTSLRDAVSLAALLDAGGDDFLSKPYNRIILKAKIEAFRRTKELHEIVQVQHDDMQREQMIAKQVFDTIAHHGALDSSNIRYMISPMAIFNGDILMVSRQPDGNMLVFLGDFTGHGLPAAIGTMPIADIFYGMSRKGFTLQSIIAEMNKKLHGTLPKGFFCCSAMVCLNFRDRTIETWTGGVPAALLYKPKTNEVVEIISKHVPLGILNADGFDAKTEFYPMSDEDRLYMMSDGVLETQSESGEMYGDVRLKQAIDGCRDPSFVFDAMISDVTTFRGESLATDDITMIEVSMLEPAFVVEKKAPPAQAVNRDGPMDWRVSYELRPGTLRSFNPVPMLMNLINEVPGLKAHSGQLFTILAELYSNALDHGVLNLDSALRTTAEGFSQYFRLREERLKAIGASFICIDIEHKPEPGGGVLCVGLRDSGGGFDWYLLLEQAAHSTSGYSGRGLPLVKSLCRVFEYRGAGNEVYVEYEWKYDVDASGELAAA